MMTSALLRQLIREQLEGILLEGAAEFDPYIVMGIDDIDVQQVLAKAFVAGSIHPIFVAEALEASGAYNQGVSTQRWSKTYVGTDGMDHTLRGISPVKYITRTWVVIPSLWGKGGAYSEGPYQIREQGFDLITDEKLLNFLKGAGVISPRLREVAIPWVMLDNNIKIGRMFLEKIAGPSKSEEEAEESFEFWLSRRERAAEAERQAQMKAAARAERAGRAGMPGGSLAPVAAPPSSSPPGPRIIRRKKGDI